MPTVCPPAREPDGTSSPCVGPSRRTHGPGRSPTGYRDGIRCRPGSQTDMTDPSPERPRPLPGPPPGDPRPARPHDPRPAEARPLDAVRASVGAALAALDEVADHPVAEHVAAYEALHTALGDALAAGSPAAGASTERR
ncbi:hypothetical protein ACFPM0_09725 [Pseudonocardia sulfidoxydans]|uniref:hypothetical protein n=2 Tax=Pseudonocardia sulfidoxydans TaxID=54011 RepID=UPI00361C5FA2